MKNPIAALAATLAALALATGARAQTYDGDWEGALEAGGQKLRLELHVKTVDGAPSAVLDSLDQGASIPTSLVKVENGELHAAFVSIGGELKGKLSADGKAIEGTWTQGATLPLKLTRKPAK
jgi:hypothetical protein